MALATLSVDLVASLAKFEGDMGRAARIAEQAANRIGGSFGGIGSVFAGSVLSNAAQEVVRQLVALVPNLVDSVAGFQDLEEKTGASAVALASFQTAADVSGTSVDSLAGFMVKLTANLSKTNDESRGAGAALKSLGLDIDTFRQLAPEKQFELIAQRLAGFKTGSLQTAVAVALLGKSGADLLPFFKELAQSGTSQIKLTKEQIALADDYSDSNTKLRSELRQQAQVAALEVLPAFSALTGELIKTVGATLDVGKASNDVKANSGLKDFAQSSVIALAVVGESVAGVVKAVALVPSAFKAAAADLKVLGNAANFVGTLGGNRKELAASLAERNATVGAFNKQLDDLVNSDGARISNALKLQFSPEGQAAAAAQAAASAAAAAKADKDKPTLTFKPPPDAEAARAAAAALREANQVRQAVLQQGLKLLQDNLADERDTLQFQQRFLDGAYDAGTVSLRDYYRERQDLADRDLQAQLETFAKEKAALQASLRSTTDPSDRVRTQTQIAEVEASAAKARRDYAQQAQLDVQQQAAGYKQLSQEVIEFAAQLEQLRGNDLGAAQIRAQQAIDNARRLSRQSSGATDETGFERELQRSIQLTEAQRRVGLVTERSAIAEERFLIAAENRGDTTLETERGIYEIRSQSLAQLGDLVRQTEALAQGAGPDSPAVRFAQQLRLEYERAAASVDPALQRLRQAQGEVAGTLSEGVTKAVLNFRDLRSAIDDVGKSLFDIATRELVTKPAEDFFRKQLRSLTEGQGVLADAAGSLFGVNKPKGGAVGAVLGATENAAGAASITALAAGGTAATASLATLTATAASADAGLLGLTVAAPALDVALLSLVGATGAASAALALLAANSAGQAGGDALGAFIKFAGFDEGGYTGGVGVTQPAGVVHGQEFVFSAPAVRRIGVATLDQLHRTARGGAPRLNLPGFADGGLVPQLGVRASAPASSRGGRSQRPIVYSPTFMVQGQIDRRTQDQIASTAYAGAQRAFARQS